jgi:ribosomal protein S10
MRFRKAAGNKKERGARRSHKRLLYCVNANSTSLDHLLLGKNADVDKSVE